MQLPSFLVWQYHAQATTPLPERKKLKVGYFSSTERTLKVVFASEHSEKIDDKSILPALVEVLSLDPRPSYHDNPERVYGLSFAGYNVRFMVDGKVLTVVDVE